jgi:hypothetical protein
VGATNPYALTVEEELELVLDFEELVKLDDVVILLDNRYPS